MFRFELEKFQRQRIVVAIVTLVMLVSYIDSAFGGLELMSGWNQEYFWENEEYRQWEMSQPTKAADEAWVAEVKAEYQSFVDANRRTDEDVKAFMEEWYDEQWRAAGYEAPLYEDVIADPYNFDNAMEILTDEAYRSREFDYFLEAFRIYIPLSEDAVGRILELQEKYNLYESYSPAQLADRDDLTEAVFSDFTPILGYSSGWDVLICVGQKLPYTLGLALLVALCTSFSAERSAAMTPILRTTRLGRRKLVNVKLARAFGITTGLWLLFQLAMLLAVAVSYGLEGASVTVMHFMDIPSVYGLNNLQYYLIQSAFSYFGTLLFSLSVCLLSSFLSVRLCLPIGLVLTLVTGFPNTSFAYSDTCFTLWQKITALTPGQMMAAFTTLQTYQSYEFGGVLIQLPCMTAIAMILEAGLLLFLLHRREGGK